MLLILSIDRRPQPLSLLSMKTLARLMLVPTLLAGMSVLSLHADNYLRNADMKNGFSSWRGDGNTAFIKPDGTEGVDGDPDVIPVIKMTLGGQSRSVYQEIETRDKPTTMHVKLEIFASSNFKRSDNKSDYNTFWKPGSVWYWSAIVIPEVDFWVRGGMNTWFYKVINLKPGAWTTLDGHFENQDPNQDRVIDFCVPAGKGTIYIKNPVVDK